MEASIETNRSKVSNTKINKINAYNKAHGLDWVAGETSVSQMTYEEKKKLF